MHLLLIICYMSTHFCQTQIPGFSLLIFINFSSLQIRTTNLMIRCVLSEERLRRTENCIQKLKLNFKTISSLFTSNTLPLVSRTKIVQLHSHLVDLTPQPHFPNIVIRPRIVLYRTEVHLMVYFR